MCSQFKNQTDPETIIFIFIDGIGFGENNPDINPFARYPAEWFRVLADDSAKLPAGLIVKTDPTMGLSGLPQSATGQTALFTGINSIEITGKHIAGFPSFSLKPVLKEKSILKKFVDHNLKATLLNGYSKRYFEMISAERHHRFLSASTLIQLSTGQPLFTIEDVLHDKALYMDITHWYLQQEAPEIPLQDPFNAGKKLVTISRNYDLTIFEYFFTDRVGHERDFKMAAKVINDLDRFIAGAVSQMDHTKELLVLSSDHGNFEDLSTAGHTTNMVPTFLIGAGENDIAQNIKNIYDIPREIMRKKNIPF